MSLDSALFSPLARSLRVIVVASTLALSRNRSKDKSKSRRSSTGTTAGSAGASTQHAGGASQRELPLSGGGLPGLPMASSCSSLADERPSSEPLGAGVRVYTCLFDAVGDVIQVRTQLRASLLTKHFGM